MALLCNNEVICENFCEFGRQNRSKNINFDQKVYKNLKNRSLTTARIRKTSCTSKNTSRNMIVAETRRFLHFLSDFCCIFVAFLLVCKPSEVKQQFKLFQKKSISERNRKKKCAPVVLLKRYAYLDSIYSQFSSVSQTSEELQTNLSCRSLEIQGGQNKVIFFPELLPNFGRTTSCSDGS